MISTQPITFQVGSAMIVAATTAVGTTIRLLNSGVKNIELPGRLVTLAVNFEMERQEIQLAILTQRENLNLYDLEILQIGESVTEIRQQLEHSVENPTEVYSLQFNTIRKQLDVTTVAPDGRYMSIKTIKLN